uniref:Uncharacterized protein n=1 Tax=Strigamia maritima TaxID=126957 RepID=T1JKN9_STRMM
MENLAQNVTRLQTRKKNSSFKNTIRVKRATNLQLILRLFITGMPIRGLTAEKGIIRHNANGLF